MDKEYRSGVDVRVALVSHLKRTLAGAEPGPKVQEVDMAPGLEPALSKDDVAPHPKADRRSLGLRGLFKPLVNPLVSPIRRYFTIKLREGLDRIEQVQRQEQIANEERHQAILRLLQETAASVQRATARMEAGTLARLDRIERYGIAAARRVAVPCEPNAVLVRSAVGYVLCPATDYGQLVTLLEGDVEPGTRVLLERLLAPGDTFVDVGANLGLHTIAAARAMKGRGAIVAFEPFAPTFELMQRSIWLNGFSRMVEGHQAAVYNAAGSKRLHLGASSSYHSLFPLAATSGFTTEMVEVPLMKLDDVLGSRATVDVIKIDAEGAELEILDGATAVLERSPEIALVVEFGPSHLRRAGQSSSDWFARFARFGLEFRAIDDATGALKVRTVAQLDAAESTNLLFARPGARAWRRADVLA
jgi:FkbM family methyltransferase